MVQWAFARMAGSAWPGAGGGGPLLILLERSAGGGHTGQPPVELPVGADHSRGGTADLLMKWAGSAKVTMDTLFLYLCTGAFHQAFFPLPPWPQPQLAVPYPPVNRPLTNEN